MTYESEYENVQFKSFATNLEPGKYTITFVYYRDGYEYYGLNKAFIKNVIIGIDLKNELKISTDYQDYPWTKNEDGIWQSSNAGLGYTESIMTTEPFYVEEGDVVSFDWAASSGNVIDDYLVYKVTNLNTGEETLYEDEKIGGLENGETYEGLQFKNVKLELEKVLPHDVAVNLYNYLKE